jgi:hypothetical protein
MYTWHGSPGSTLLEAKLTSAWLGSPGNNLAEGLPLVYLAPLSREYFGWRLASYILASLQGVSKLAGGSCVPGIVLQEVIWLEAGLMST